MLSKGLSLPIKSFTIRIVKVRPLENILSTEGGKNLRGRLNKNFSERSIQMRKKRVSVSLPPDMLAHYKDLAETAGISISRLIYLRLKSRKKSIVIVGRDLLSDVRELKSLVEALIQGKPLNEEVVDSLIRYSRFLENFVVLNNVHDDVVIGGGRRGN